MVIAPWPEFPANWRDPAMEQRMARMQELVRTVREVRNRYKVDQKTKLDVSVRCSELVARDFGQLAAFITVLAGVGELKCGPDVSKAAAGRDQRASRFRGVRVAPGPD